jgi:hypothetical protein
MGRRWRLVQESIRNRIVRTKKQLERKLTTYSQNELSEFLSYFLLLQTGINFRRRLNYQQEFRSCLQAYVLSS